MIDDGTILEPNDCYVYITIPKEFLISNFSEFIESIVTNTHHDLINNYKYSKYL